MIQLVWKNPRLAEWKISTRDGELLRLQHTHKGEIPAYLVSPSKMKEVMFTAEVTFTKEDSPLVYCQKESA